MLLIGTGNGLYRANKDAITPLALGDHGGLRCPVVVDKDDVKRLYAGTSRDGVFRSEDGGETWREINITAANSMPTPSTACQTTRTW